MHIFTCNDDELDAVIFRPATVRRLIKAALGKSEPGTVLWGFTALILQPFRERFLQINRVSVYCEKRRESSSIYLF